MKRSQEELVESEKHPLKILKHRRVRFDLPIKEKEEYCPSSVSVSQDTHKETSHHLDQVKSFPSPSVEGSLPVAENATKTQEMMTPSTHLQQEMDCGLPARETQTTSSTNAPVVSGTMGCPPEKQSPRSLLSVEEEIVQILAEMQMKSNEPRIMDVTRLDTGEKIEETAITNDLGDNALSASQMRVQLALKLATKEEGSSRVLLSPPVVDQASRTLLSLQQEKTVLPQDAQVNNKRLEAKVNSQYPSNSTVADIHNSNAKENSDEIEVVYERRKHVPVSLVVKHEKSAVQQLEAGHFSVDRRDVYSSNPSVAGIYNSNVKGCSDEIEVVYERRKHGPTRSKIKCETSAVQQEEAGHFSEVTKEMESSTTVHSEKTIKNEEEKYSVTDTHASVSGFPSDINSAQNSILDTEYDCPMCALAATKAWDENQEKAACLNMICLNMITQNLFTGSNRDTTGNERVTASPNNVKEEITGCPTAVGASNRDTAGNEQVTASPDNVKEEEPVTNCDGYDVKEERNRDYIVISDDLDLESPMLDCGVSAVPLNKEDTIDTEGHDMTSDNMSEISSYKSDIDIVKEEIYFSDQDQDALEMDCPSEIHVSENETVGGIEETVTLSEVIEACLQPQRKERSPVSTVDKSVEADIPLEHKQSTPVSTVDKSVEADLHLEHQESLSVSTKRKTVDCAVQAEIVEIPPASKEDESVESGLHSEQQETSPVSAEDNSVASDGRSRIADNPPASKEDESDESGLHSEQQETSPVSAEDNSVESGHSSEKLQRPLVSTGDSSVLFRYFPNCWNPNRILVVKLRRIEMANYYKGIESGLHSEQQETSPVSAEDNNLGTSMQDGKSTHIRKRKDKAQADSCIEAPPEIYRHHIPGCASENHQIISSKSLENTTENFSQEKNLSLKNYEEINGHTACNYKCSSCSDIFSSKYSLTKHVFTHIGLDAPVHICKYCGEVFNAALELQKHNKSSCYGIVHKELSHFSHQSSKCKDGVKNFEAKNEIIDCEFTCSSCEQVFISKYSLIKHVFNHIDGVQPPSHICKLCGKILSASFSLRRHYKYGCRKSYRNESCHTGNELQEAIQIDNKIVNGDDMEKQEAAQVKFALNTTNQDFKSKDVHDHIGDKETHSYKCSVCGGHFLTASRLRKHFLKICNRIEHSIQSNEVQGIPEEKVVLDGSAKHNKIVRKATNCELKCSTCQKVFNTEFHLEMHKSKKIKCTAPEQKDRVVDLFDKVRYLPEINDPSQHQSDILVKSVPSSNLKISNIHVTYRTSVKTGRKEKVFLCDFCDKPFRKASNLLTHRHTHTGEKYCICSICGKSFSMMGNLKRHLMSHSGDYPYSCNICKRQFKQKEHLKRHRRIHTGETPHKCHICGKCFRQSGSLQKHKVVHTGDRPYQCEVCGRTFALLGNLNQHSRTHSAERTYKCDICLKSFSRSTTLKKHSCISPGEGRRFKCNFCCKYFRSRSLLKQHLATHLGIRPYKCNICSKTFIGSGNLKVHMYIHTGEKPYICEVCGKTFNQCGSMRRHLRVHKRT